MRVGEAQQQGQVCSAQEQQRERRSMLRGKVSATRTWGSSCLGTAPTNTHRVLPHTGSPWRGHPAPANPGIQDPAEH